MANSATLARILKKPQGISRKTWRDALRNHVGPGGERLWAVLMDLADGRAWRPTYRDERGVEVVGEPIAPTSADRIAAVRELAHMLYGKPVSQTEALRAETEAADVEAARALTDAELEARVRRLVLDPGPEQVAEITEGKN